MRENELVERIREGIRGKGPKFTLQVQANPSEWRDLIDAYGDLENLREMDKTQAQIDELDRECVFKLQEAQEEIRRLRELLSLAWVDYDTCPYMHGTEEIERLELHPRLGFYYRLDDQAINDALQARCFVCKTPIGPRDHRDFGGCCPDCVG